MHLSALPIRFVSLMATILLLSVATAASAQQSGDSDETRRLIVLPLAASGVSEDVASSLDDLLVIELERTQLFEVTARQDLKALLSQVELKQLLGVDDEKELARVGNRLNAAFLLRGSIGKVGGTYLLSLTLIDVEEARSVRRVNQTLVGDPDGLVGSLHAAVVALALEEEGVAPSLTAGLIESMNIARKPKTLFVRFGAGYEMPVGPTIDDDDLAYMMPGMMQLNLSAGYNILPWLQVVAETGAAFSIAEKFSMQNKQLYVRNVDGATNPDGSTLWELETLTNTTDFDYGSLRVPFQLMLRFQPSEGRLLPYAMTGLGISWQRYSFGDERIQHLDDSKRVDDAAYPCLAPYISETGETGYFCIDDTTLTPGEMLVDDATNEISFSKRSTISYFNLQFPIVVGVDYLITHHFGVGFEARYLLTYSIDKDEQDLNAKFYSERDNYDRDSITFTKAGAPGGQTYTKGGGDTREVLLDDVPIRRLHHGISVLIGLFYYF